MYAHQLLGKDLDGNWRVVEKPDKGPKATGGNFSVGYIVENGDGRRGFLKALDFFAAFAPPPGMTPADLFSIMTEAYIFERDVCERCRNRSFDRIVHAIESGYIEVVPSVPSSKVEYLIFDLAQGDLRKILDSHTTFDVAFALRTLHHTAVGLHQLHSAEMAHQDLKPSNVLVFPEGQGSRIADLGRAWVKDMEAPHDALPIAGAKPYAPPEFIFGAIPVETERRRYGCDLYHLGSLLVFMFTRTTITALLIKHIAKDLRAATYPGSYAAYLPYLQNAFADAVEEFGAHVPEQFRARLIEVVKQLCEPDPSRRGHPLDRKRNPLTLERYISTLNTLAHKAETQLARGTT